MFAPNAVLESIAKIVVGSLAGRAIEAIAAPQLPGFFRGAPIRPIYGVGLACSTKDERVNAMLASTLEVLGHGMKDGLWDYDPQDPLTVSPAINASNAVRFGKGMKLANKLWETIFR